MTYEDPYTGNNIVTVVRNALYVPLMKNLIPPFIMREKGFQVKDTPKIHIAEPDEDDHAIVFTGKKLRIPPQLWGVLSYLPSWRPMVEELKGAKEIYLLNRPQFNLHDEAYAENDLNIMDWQGKMIE